ncbi:MAG: hypothetical protein M1833_006628 [Piccolia ochrophora]|nr:MAG: hypothetical protein M1833_006628 [Piccolia ochrophora]
MLGRLRMTVDECLEAYRHLDDDIFARPRRRSLLWFRPKYDPHALQKSIGHIVREYAPAALQRGQEDVFASDPVQCKTAVVSFSVKSGKPFVFRTYDLSDSKGIQDKSKSERPIIWKIKSTPLGPKDTPEWDHKETHASLLRIFDAARATSAAPGYFTSFRVRSQVYVDGGLAANNPSLLMCSELKEIRKKAVEVEKDFVSPQETPVPSGAFIDTFISIGVSKKPTSTTGANRDSTRSILRRNSDLLHKLQALVELDSVSSNETDSIMQSLTKTGDIASYYRFITDPSLSNLSLKHWQESRKEGNQASSEANISIDRQICAERLVHVKRRREETSRWSSFAGPLCYSREQLSAESTSIASSLTESLSHVREAPNKIVIDSPSRGNESARVLTSGAEYHDAIKMQNFTKIADVSSTSYVTFQAMSRRACGFVWRVPEFYQDLKTPTTDCFDNIVTINRVCGDKYWACTCIAFIESRWPDLGVSIFRLVSKICQVISREDAFHEDNIDCGIIRINARATTSLLMLEPVDSPAPGDASPTGLGPFQLLIDCIRWLTCALMPSDLKKGIFRTNMVSISSARIYVLAFKSFDPSREDCYCWTSMFSYACVIDLGFNAERPPILTAGLCKVTEKEPAGLKMDYELMLELAGVDHALNREKVTNLEEFKGRSVHVGWAMESKILLGTSLSAAAQDLRGSNVKTVDRLMGRAQDLLAVQLQQTLPGGGPLLGGQFQRVWNYQSTLSPATRLAQFELSLNGSKTRQVILYDEETKNATLVPELALLVFATLRYINHYGYTHFSRQSDALSWVPISDLRLPSQCYDIATESEGILLENLDTTLSKDARGRGVVLFKEVVNAMTEVIDRGNSACREEISKKRRSGKKALYGFDLREAILTEDIYFRRLKCTASMQSWAAAAEQTAVIFVNGLGGLIVPACPHEDCMTTYPGLLNGTFSSLETEYSRNLWNHSDQHRRIKNTDFQWIMHGQPFSQCKHRHNAATTTCDDVGRIQKISHNSNFKAIFHRRKELKRQLNVVGNIRVVWKEDMWSQRVWSERCLGGEMKPYGAVRFGKIRLRPHCTPDPPDSIEPAPSTATSTTPITLVPSATFPNGSGTSTSTLNGLAKTESPPSTIVKISSAAAALGSPVNGIDQRASA